MPLTTLDPRTALIVIDLQQGLRGFPSVHDLVVIANRAATMAAAFRRHHLPVVLVNVDDGPPGRTMQSRHPGPFPAEFVALMPELDVQPSDHLVTKRTWGAFTGTDLESYLSSSGVTQVVVCGVATSIGVESTARQAHELGFNVTLATDAMTDLNAAAHANSIDLIFPRLGELGTAQEVIDRVEAGSQRSPGSTRDRAT